MTGWLDRSIDERGWRKLAIVIGLAAATMSAALLLMSSPAGAQDKPTLSITAVDATTGMVTITNHGDADVDPNGVILCNFPAYGPISGADVIAPGESLTVDSGAAGVALDPSGGEMGLYTESSFESADAMVAYVEWGTSGHERSPVAVEAGLWSSGDFVATETGVLTASVDAPTSAADWDGGDAAAQDDDPDDDTADDTTELAVTGADTWILALTATGLLLVGGAITGVSLSARRRATTPLE